MIIRTINYISKWYSIQYWNKLGGIFWNQHCSLLCPGSNLECLALSTCEAINGWSFVLKHTKIFLKLAAESIFTKTRRRKRFLWETSLEFECYIFFIFFYHFVLDDVESGCFFSRWTDQGTSAKPCVWCRPKLMHEGVESEVLNLETAETRPSIVSFSTSIFEVSAFLGMACLRRFFCLFFLEGGAFLKNSNDEGNLCLSTRCCCRLL